MSNYPQPPSGQPPYGQPPQQTNYAPAGAYAMQPQQQSNGWGVAALVTGIISMCVPIVGGLLAILLGFLGIKRAGKTHTGKGLAVAGLVLGLLSTIGWGIFVGVVGIAGLTFWQVTAPNRDLGKQFVQDLAAGNTTAAANAVDANNISDEDLKGFADLLSKHGTVKDITTVSASASTEDGQGEAVLGGSINFNDGTMMNFQMHQIKTGGAWKITYFSVE